MKKTPETDCRSEAGPEEDIRKYFQSIEAHFIRRRGAPLLLSPRDVDRIAHWHKLQIPLMVVFRGIDSYFERKSAALDQRQKMVTLAFCEQDILAAWKGRGDRDRGRPRDLPLQQNRMDQEMRNTLSRILTDIKDAFPEMERSQTSILVATLKEVCERLQILLRDRHQLQQRREGLSGSVEKELEHLDGMVAQALLVEVGEEEYRSLLHAAEGEMESYRRQMEGDMFLKSVKQLAAKRLRQRFNLPFISLYSI